MYLLFSILFVCLFQMLAWLFANIVCVLVLAGSTETTGEVLFHFHSVPPEFRQNAVSNMSSATTNETFHCALYRFNDSFNVRELGTQLNGMFTF